MHLDVCVCVCVCVCACMQMSSLQSVSCYLEVPLHVSTLHASGHVARTDSITELHKDIHTPAHTHNKVYP
jgi:hypothetical protein